MSKVTPITYHFDRDVDQVLGWFHEPTTAPIRLPSRNDPATEVIPASILPVGPTTQPLNIEPETVHHWAVSYWMFVAGFTVGMVVMAGLLRSM